MTTIRNSVTYYLLLLTFPVSFLLHGMNENFGLIPEGTLGGLLLTYLAITCCIAVTSRLIFKNHDKAFILSILLLLTYFLFGVSKDLFDNQRFLKPLLRYKLLLPAISFMIILFIVYLKKTSGNGRKLARFIAVFLLVNLGVESVWAMYQYLSGAAPGQDFGDYNHVLLAKNPSRPSNQKPSVFWLVFDEYAASSTLKKVWQFTNPLDDSLRSKGFYVADAATSNYNFTHYSITSILDMIYLEGLSNRSVVTLRDLSRGTYSVYDNNVMNVFAAQGYDIQNYTIFQMKGHPTKGMLKFKEVPHSLIDFRTMGGRIQHDIGWNFPNMFSPSPMRNDSLDEVRSLINLHNDYNNLLNRSFEEIRDGARRLRPSFFMMHLMLPHEPFIYQADGTLALQNGFNELPQNYIPQVRYTNSIVNRITDSILQNYKQRDVAIIIQGDHGFKFKEHDPLYESESCRIMYGVYCSDRNYAGWYNSMSAVNGFRILFNKYFGTKFPLLPDTSYNLLYRIK